MSKIKSDFQTPLIHGLACACLDEQLRSVLLFDANAITLRAIADIVNDMLTVIGQKVTRFTLNSSTSEENIWGHYTFQKQAVDWQVGKLLISDDDIKLVLIPDLSRLNLAAIRTMVMLLSTEVAHLQRHGQDADIPISNLFWLAACPNSEVGMLTPHLLDRFALRLSTQSSLVNSEMGDKLPQQLSLHLQTAAKQWPEISRTIINQVTDYFEENHPRRELALARLATAIARLENANQVTTEHLKTAARLIGLQLPEITDEPYFDEPSAITPELPSNLQFSEPFPEAEATDNTTEITVSTPTETEIISEPIPLPDPPISPPYPEDTAPIQHADNPLKLPAYRHSTTKAYGLIIGTQRTGELRDIAWVATILEAAKFQKVRDNNDFPNSPLLISRHDLYSHRRILPPQHLLVLVLDYTCLQDCQWQESLIPHLRRAYIERASVCLIQVGAKTDNKTQELCAQRITAPNILVPRISEALETEPGRATPLAHGLDLTLLTLRSNLQHGRNAAQQATLIIITDGRGNVPLQASHTGRIITPVNREGIEDTIKVAQKIQGMQNLHIILFNPQPQLQSELPIGLANTLGAVIENISINPNS
jgi:magnesium chelatase subunit D